MRMIEASWWWVRNHVTRRRRQLVFAVIQLYGHRKGQESTAGVRVGGVDLLAVGSQGCWAA